MAPAALQTCPITLRRLENISITIELYVEQYNAKCWSKQASGLRESHQQLLSELLLSEKNDPLGEVKLQLGYFDLSKSLNEWRQLQAYSGKVRFGAKEPTNNN